MAYHKFCRKAPVGRLCLACDCCCMQLRLKNKEIEVLWGFKLKISSKVCEAF